MKSFIEYSKEVDKSELQRQKDHHEEMAEKHKEKANEFLMAGDLDGHALHMAKHDHFKVQGDRLKAVKEEVEQVDELSKGTLGSYVKHAARDIGASRKLATDFAHNAKSARKQSVKDANKRLADKFKGTAMKRHAGIDKAVERLAKEEVELDEATPAWQRKEGKSASGGLNRKGIASYRKANPGSKLSMAVTTKPSKLKPGSKAANRRKSFCARMGGMKKRLTSAKTAKDPNSRINKALRKWNC